MAANNVTLPWIQLEPKGFLSPTHRVQGVP
jgi:hypothetical protein